MIIVSDLHIGHKQSALQAMWKLVSEYANEDFIIVGDFYEGYLKHPDKISKEHHHLISAILYRAKVYVVGNHDSFMKNLVEVNFGHVKIAYPYYRIEVDGKKWIITHGHLLGRFGWIFKFLDYLDDIRGFPTLANFVASLPIFSSVRRLDKKFNKLEEKALEFAWKNDADVVVCGHNHIQAVNKYGRYIYVNPGSALGDLEYIYYKDGKFYAKKILERRKR